MHNYLDLLNLYCKALKAHKLILIILASIFSINLSISDLEAENLDFIEETRNSDFFQKDQDNPNNEANVPENELIGEQTGSDSKAFFTKGLAGSPYDKELKLTKQIDPYMLNSKAKKEEERKEELKRINIAEIAKDNKKIDRIPSKNREELVKKFGNPEQDAPIIAREDSPKPVAAMLDALELGDNELAYKYARQYARYLKELKQRSQKVAKMSDLAMQSEGIKPLDPLSEDPQYDEIRDLFLEDLNKQNEWNTKRIKLNPKVKTIVEKAIAEEDKSIRPPEYIPTKDQPYENEDPKNRITVRQAIAKTFPRDPKGKVDVYLFVRQNASNTLMALNHFSELANKYINDPNVLPVAMTLDSIEDDSELELLLTNLNVQFPLRDGYEMAKKLNITRPGTILFVSRTTGEAVIEEGGRNIIYLDEAVKFMKGM